MEHKYDNSIVYNADCMEIMRGIPDNYFDLSVVDPPYGININVNMGRRKGDKKSDYHKFHGNDSSIPTVDFFVELKRISNHCIVWGGNYMTEFLRPSPCWILWDKGFSSEVTFGQFEMAWTSYSSSTKKFEFNAAANKQRIHPTQKPIALYDWIYANYLPQGGKVFDSHLGSQSNRISAYKRGNIDFTACELDKDYFNDGNARFMEFVKKYQPAHLEPITANGQNKLF